MTDALKLADSNLSTEEQVTTIWKLGGLSVTQLGRRVIKGMTEDVLVDRAAALAFNFILALFPLFLFLLSLLGIFASRGSALQNDLMSNLARVMPPAAFQVITHTLQEVTKNAGGGKITLGILLTLWFAAGGMTSMISALNGVYDVPETRSIIKVRAIALSLTVAISVLIVSALLAVLAGDFTAHWIASHYGLGGAVVMAARAVEWIIAVAFVTLSFSLIYYFGADIEEQHWYWITPGSIIGVLLWIAASFGFRVYLHFFNSYSKTYGSLGAAIILLMWLYITGLAFLIGGEINAQIEHAAAERGHPEAKAPGEKKAA
jgi:membrane protein